MSKKQKSIMIILTLVTLLGVLVALFFLPDKVSLHYGVKGADPPAGLISKAVEQQNWLYFLAFVGMSVLISAIFVGIAAHFYQKMNTATFKSFSH